MQDSKWSLNKNRTIDLCYGAYRRPMHQCGNLLLKILLTALLVRPATVPLRRIMFSTLGIWTLTLLIICRVHHNWFTCLKNGKKKLSHI